MATINLQNPQTATSNITINGAQLMASMTNASPSITLGNTNPFANISSVGTINLDSFALWDNPHVKKYEIIETNEDLMALSTAWYRIRMSRDTSAPVEVYPTTLLDKVLFPEVNTEDRQNAADIRDYYSKKVMMWKLKGQELTNFQKDMNEFIHTDGTKFQEKMIPLVYSLPGFYFYDKEFDVMASEHHTKIATFNDVTTKKLSLLKVLNSGKRSNKKKDYWFSDDQDHLVKMTFQADNPLLSLLDNYAQDYIHVKGLYTKITRDDRDFFFLTKQRFI
jgi:hypothetical protein